MSRGRQEFAGLCSVVCRRKPVEFICTITTVLCNQDGLSLPGAGFVGAPGTGHNASSSFLFAYIGRHSTAAIRHTNSNGSNACGQEYFLDIRTPDGRGDHLDRGADITRIFVFPCGVLYSDGRATLLVTEVKPLWYWLRRLARSGHARLVILCSGPQCGVSLRRRRRETNVSGYKRTANGSRYGLKGESSPSTGI